MVELTALSSKSGIAGAILLNFYVSHSNTANILRGGENILYVFCR